MPFAICLYRSNTEVIASMLNLMFTVRLTVKFTSSSSYDQRLLSLTNFRCVWRPSG